MFAAFPSNIVLSGVSYINAIESKPGTILHEKFDVLSLGPFHNPSLPVSAEMTAAKDFIRIYSAAGKTQAPYCEDVPAARWGKMVMNAAVNPLSAITGLNFGQLRLTESSEMMLMRPAMEEVVSVAKALGVVLPEGLVDAQINIVPIDLYSVPSMMLDVQEVSYSILSLFIP
jgi:ketopantoate reductase